MSTTEFNDLIDSTGISKKKIAEIAGVEPQTVSRWCSGKSPVPQLLLEKLRKINNAINN